MKINLLSFIHLTCHRTNMNNNSWQEYSYESCRNYSHSNNSTPPIFQVNEPFYNWNFNNDLPSLSSSNFNSNSTFNEHPLVTMTQTDSRGQGQDITDFNYIENNSTYSWNNLDNNNILCFDNWNQLIGPRRSPSLPPVGYKSTGFYQDFREPDHPISSYYDSAATGNHRGAQREVIERSQSQRDQIVPGPSSIRRTNKRSTSIFRRPALPGRRSRQILHSLPTTGSHRASRIQNTSRPISQCPPTRSTTTSTRPTVLVPHNSSTDLNLQKIRIEVCLESMSRKRKQIRVKDLPDCVKPYKLCELVPDTHYNIKNQVVHFGKNRVGAIASALKSINPAIKLMLAGSILTRRPDKNQNPGTVLPVTPDNRPRNNPIQSAHSGFAQMVCTTILQNVRKAPNQRANGHIEVIDLTDSSVIHEKPDRSKEPTSKPGAFSISAKLVPTTSSEKVPVAKSPFSGPKPIPPTENTISKPKNTEIPMNIPGYDVIQHLIFPYHLRSLYSNYGNCYKKFEVNLSPGRIQQIYEPKSRLVVLLRLVITNSYTGDIVDQKSNILKVNQLEINGECAKLTKKEGQRFNIDITRYVHGRRRSTVGISAKVDKYRENNLNILCYISLVRKHNAKELLKDLVAKGKIAKDETRDLITHSLNNAAEDGILTADKLTISVRCPLSKTLMKIPCRGVYCDHYSCFDASNFLAIYEYSEKWICPICDCNLDREDLRVDSFYEEILSSIGDYDTNDYKVEVDTNGEFCTSASRRKEKQSKNQDPDETLTLLSDDNDDEDGHEANDADAVIEVPSPKDISVLCEEESTLDVAPSSSSLGSSDTLRFCPQNNRNSMQTETEIQECKEPTNLENVTVNTESNSASNDKEMEGETETVIVEKPHDPSSFTNYKETEDDSITIEDNQNVIISVTANCNPDEGNVKVEDVNVEETSLHEKELKEFGNMNTSHIYEPDLTENLSKDTTDEKIDSGVSREEIKLSEEEETCMETSDEGKPLHDVEKQVEKEFPDISEVLVETETKTLDESSQDHHIVVKSSMSLLPSNKSFIQVEVLSFQISQTQISPEKVQESDVKLSTTVEHTAEAKNLDKLFPLPSGSDSDFQEITTPKVTGELNSYLVRNIPSSRVNSHTECPDPSPLGQKLRGIISSRKRKFNGEDQYSRQSNVVPAYKKFIFSD